MTSHGPPRPFAELGTDATGTLHPPSFTPPTLRATGLTALAQQLGRIQPSCVVISMAPSRLRATGQLAAWTASTRPTFSASSSAKLSPR